MKKTLAVILALCLMVSLVSCGNNKNQDTNDNKPAVKPDTEVVAPPVEDTDKDSNEEINNETGSENTGDVVETPDSENPVDENTESDTPTEETPNSENPADETPDSEVTDSNTAEDKETSNTEEVESASKFDAIVNKLSEANEGNFPALMKLDAEAIEAFYPGLENIKIKEMAIYTPMISSVAFEPAMVEVADSADIETVKDVFQARIDSQVAGGAWYPATIEVWENSSKIVTVGNNVMLIAWDSCDQAVDMFNTMA